MPTADPAEPRVWRVDELTRMIRTALEREFGEVWVVGEISNLRIPASGHCYFTLKDEGSQIGAVLWRDGVRALSFVPQDGLQVRVRGRLTVYERGGNYQIVVREMIVAGEGALYAAFEALKRRLEAEGLFEAARKKPLPPLPRHVGIVTSPTGAAIRDILTVLGRRFRNLHILIAPVRVQGAGAAEEIAAAIDLLNERGGLDVLIVGRGGGSLEELWCFNEEIVARAIVRSRIPVISAVGHEIDTTISDFVADVRAPTPSAAAEMLVAPREEFEEGLRATARRLGSALQESLLRARGRLAAARESYVFREPGHRVRLARERIEGWRRAMTRRLQGRWRESQQTLDEMQLRLGREVRAGFEQRTQTVRRLALQLRALNPLGVLERGYSLTRDGDGRILRSTAGVRPGARVFTRLAHGELEAEVTKIHDEEKGG